MFAIAYVKRQHSREYRSAMRVQHTHMFSHLANRLCPVGTRPILGVLLPLWVLTADDLVGYWNDLEDDVSLNS